ncbi:hypothetical protein EI427_19815 [Flammeovirga pectinis]|uniref:Tetratricopeptide repeat protein n=1 Tax=Flammeovirga pectinis TaxID=2494373 RepID=A0A3S9P835_9BACT|nr:hypothetical protein [Flammeovirga pectinis]AZQ64375.1 hypothetical protein EI427_19815 [Flammeovirga pectinis]
MKFTKIITVLALSAAVSSTAFAQEKGSATKAEAYLSKGELTEAQSEIENAVGYEKYKLESKGKPVVVKEKTLETQGDVYSTIARTAETPAEEIPVDIEKAMSAYNEIKKRKEDGGKETSSYKAIWDNQGADLATGAIKPSKVDDLWGHFFNIGAEAFNDQEYTKAMDNFKLALLVKNDTTTGKYGFYASALAEEEAAEEDAAAVRETTMMFINKLFEMNYHDPQQYYSLLRYAAEDAAPAEERLDDLKYEMRDAEGTIEKSTKTKEQSQERYDYYTKGGGRKYGSARQKAAQAKTEVDEANAELTAAQATLDAATKEVAELEGKTDAVYEECLQIAIKGAENNPGNPTLTSQMVSYYVKLDKLDEAIASVQSAIDKDPTDEGMNFNLAVLYDQASEKARSNGDEAKADELFNKATDQYKKVIEINPESKNGLFNLGALYYNRAAAYNKEMQDLPMKGMNYADPAKAKELEAKMLEYAKMSAPYAEKVSELAPDESKYLVLLSRIYYMTKENDKLEAVNQKLESME